MRHTMWIFPDFLLSRLDELISFFFLPLCLFLSPCGQGHIAQTPGTLTPRQTFNILLPFALTAQRRLPLTPRPLRLPFFPFSL